MEIACVIDQHPAAPARPGRSGGFRPGRAPASSAADPVAAAERTEVVVRALEAIGAAVESERSGEAFFAVGGLRGIHGGDRAGVLAAAGEALRGALGADPEPRIGVAPTRLAAFAAARLAGGTCVEASGLHAFLAPLRVAILPHRLGAPAAESEALALALERLGIATLGALARLSPDQVADRFGPLGLRALRLARGEDEPLRPRAPHEELVEQIELPEGTMRAPARPRPRAAGRPPAGGAAAPRPDPARAASGGAAGRRRQLERRAGPRSSQRLGPGPAHGAGTAAALAAGGRPRRCGCGRSGSGPAAADQLELAVGGAEPRQRRLAAAVREVRAAQGPEALLRILPVDTASRVPERWALLTPFPEP